MTLVIQKPKLIIPTLRSWNRLPHLAGKFSTPTVPGCPGTWWDAELSAEGLNRYPILGNANDGDCVVAWILHQIESQWRRTHFGQDIAVAQQDVIATEVQATTWYWAEVARQGGGPNQTPPGPGLDPVQAVQDWKRYGIACGTEENFAAGAVQVDTTNQALIRWAAYNFAGLGLVLELGDNYVQLANNPNQVWTYDPAFPPDPNLGHMALLSGYSGGTIGIKSWGTGYKATWEWLNAYCSGIIAVLTDDWTNIPGLNELALETELNSFGGSQFT